MSKTKRSLNKCRACGDTWYPRGRELSNKCPKCGSNNVSFAGPGLIGTLLILGFFILTGNNHSNNTSATPNAVTGPVVATAVSDANTIDQNTQDSTPSIVPNQELAPVDSTVTADVASPQIAQTRKSIDSVNQQPTGNTSQIYPALSESTSVRGSPVPAIWAPSFDCGKATTEVTSLICSNKELSDVDVALSQAYNAAWKGAIDKQAFTVDQIAWQKNDRDVCKDVPCILQAYKNRLAQLGAQGNSGDRTQ